jgi:phosphatidate phosphatase LPIN
VKSLRATAEQLASLKLKEGANSIRFSVYSKLQGTREVRATIYLWSLHEKMVISDIDGTITKYGITLHIIFTN